MLDELLFGIDVVEDNISVSLVAGRKHDNFEVLINELETLAGKRPDVEASPEDFARHGGDVEVDVGGPCGVLLADAVRECLVQVEDYRLADARLRERQVDHASLDFFLLNLRKALKEAN